MLSNRFCQSKDHYPVQKERPRSECGNHLGISLLSTVLLILLYYKDWQAHVNNVYIESQHGYIGREEEQIFINHFTKSCLEERICCKTYLYSLYV